MKGKKGGLASGIAIIILVLILIAAGFLIYKNFHTTCVINNLKSFSMNMSNCVR